MTRRDWFRLAAGGGLATSAYAVAESRWFEVSRTVVRMPRLEAPLRVLHLADLHSSAAVPTPLLVDAVRAGLAQKPDVVFLTGDYISTFRQYDEEGLAGIFGSVAKAAPAFAVMGNHDDNDEKSSAHLQSLLRTSGVEVLMNRSEVANIRRQKIEISGTGDLWNTREFDPKATFAGVSGEHPVILLAHNPDTKDAVAHAPWDLMLSGHTHGGQVLVPFVQPFWSPVYDKRYIAGLYPWNGRQLYITRGVGSHKGIRFRCRPEVSILDLRPAAVQRHSVRA